MTKGGLAPRRVGDAFEVLVARDMEERGWETWRVRQGAQGGESVDIIAVQACQNGYSDHHWRQPHVQLIQARLRGNMTKAEKEALKLRAENINAVAVLASKENGHVRYEVIRDV